MHLASFGSKSTTCVPITFSLLSALLLKYAPVTKFISLSKLLSDRVYGQRQGISNN